MTPYSQCIVDKIQDGDCNEGRLVFVCHYFIIFLTKKLKLGGTIIIAH